MCNNCLLDLILKSFGLSLSSSKLQLLLGLEYKLDFSLPGAWVFGIKLRNKLNFNKGWRAWGLNKPTYEYMFCLAVLHICYPVTGNILSASSVLDYNVFPKCWGSAPILEGSWCLNVSWLTNYWLIRTFWNFWKIHTINQNLSKESQV